LDSTHPQISISNILLSEFTGARAATGVPLVEFRFDSPRGQITAATANPGLVYVAVTRQVFAEAILPLNHAGGTGPSFCRPYWTRYRLPETPRQWTELHT